MGDTAASLVGKLREDLGHLTHQIENVLGAHARVVDQNVGLRMEMVEKDQYIEVLEDQVRSLTTDKSQLEGRVLTLETENENLHRHLNGEG